MAFPEVRAVGAQKASTAAIEPALPAGILPGDLLLGFFESAGATTGTEATTELTIAGWTVIVTEKKGNTRATVAYKRATGTADRRLTNDTGDHQLGRLLCLKTGTFNEEEPIHKSAISTQASTKSVKCPSVTTTVAECLILFGCTGHLPDASAENLEFSAEANAALASITERVDNTTAEGDGGALLVTSGTKATAGAVGESTATAATEAERVCFTIAIAPYVDPGSPKPIASTKTEATGTSAEITRVTGEAGDIILVAIYATLNKTISVAGGTVVGTPKFVTGGPMCATFWVPWSAGEKIKVTWTGSESQTYVVEQVSYRNCNTTNPIDVASNWEEKASSQSPVAPAVETTGPSRRVIAMTSNVNGNEPDEWPAEMTGRISYVPAICDVHQAAKGSTGTKTFHLTIARVTGVQTLALKKLSGEYSTETTETLSTSDAVKQATVVSRSSTEGLSISDSPARATATKRTISETLSTVDANARIAVVARILVETLSISDANVRSTGIGRSTSAALSTSDANTHADVAARKVAEGLTTSDAVVAGLAYIKFVSESTSISDIVKRAFTGARAIAESLTTSDSNKRATGVGRIPIETLTTSDAPSRSNGAFVRAIAQALTTSDAPSRFVAALRQVSDSLTTSDAVKRSTGVGRKPAEALSTSDAATRSNGIFARAVAQALTTSDATTHSAGSLFRKVAEILSTGDSPQRQAGASRKVAETLTTNDLATFLKVILRSTSETLSTSEIPIYSSGIFHRVVTQLTTTNDVVTRVANALRVIQDAVTGTDDPTQHTVLIYHNGDIVRLEIPQEMTSISSLKEDVAGVKARVPDTLVTELDDDEILISTFTDTITVNKIDTDLTLNVPSSHDQLQTKFGDKLVIDVDET